MELIFRILLASCLPAALAQSQNAPPPPWGLGMDNVPSISVPASMRDKLDLEYEDTDTIRGVSVDLNGDGIKDYVIRSAPSLCGNGGCPYALFDGATGKELGQVFGNPLYILAKKVHDWPVIETLNHLSAESANLTTYTFTGKAYVAASTRQLEGTTLDSVVTALRHIPLWRPRP